MNESAQVSHGRGGAANIAPDQNTYTDGSIVREGPVGDQGTGAFSAGRGGTGNIGSPHLKPTGVAGDADVVPETALRPEYDNYHTGRGGEGNIHKEAVSGSSVPASTHSKTSLHAPTPTPKSGRNSVSRNGSIATGTAPESTNQGAGVIDNAAGPSSEAAAGETEGKEGSVQSDNKTDKEAKRAAWRENNPPPEHDGLGDRAKYWVKKKIYG
ncbi:hypothetical protein MMC10_007641 [Thelotrema lepadinum]|nr:hypothetical protein [Thelotrema lepadinum]